MCTTCHRAIILSSLCGSELAGALFSSASLQARHPVHPGLTLPRETGQVPRSTMVAVVIGPGDRGSGGCRSLVPGSKRQRVASVLLFLYICKQKKKLDNLTVSTLCMKRLQHIHQSAMLVIIMLARYEDMNSTMELGYN